MKIEKIVFGLDIGTTKIVCLAGKLNEHGKLDILGMGKSESLGVRRGIVNNIMQTVKSINHAIDIIEKDFSIPDMPKLLSGHFYLSFRDERDGHFDCWLDSDGRFHIEELSKI